MIQSRWSQNLLLGFSVVVLVLLTWWGFTNGVKAAKAKRILNDANILKSAFDEFHKDQNRYPATTEFQNEDVMKQYVSNFPPQQFPDSLCKKNFDYFSGTAQTYELRFCLPKAVSGFNLGLNTLKP